MSSCDAVVTVYMGGLCTDSWRGLMSAAHQL